jgi:predicted MFS family arabinose efflux permease
MAPDLRGRGHDFGPCNPRPGVRSGQGFGAESPIATLRERIAVVAQRPVLLTLLVTLFWTTGAYTVYTYLVVFLASETGIDGAHAGLVLFMWGVSAAVGVTAGGRLNDRLGSKAVIISALAVLPPCS